MARAAPPLPISPKMFRHFAILTVAITACVAMFADGEGREAIEQQLKERQQQNDLLIAEAQKVGKRSVGFNKISGGKGAVAAANASVDWSDDSGGDLSAPMDSAGGGGGAAAPTGPRGLSGSTLGPSKAVIVPPRARSSAPRATQPAQQAPTQDQLDQLMEASRSRSG